MIKTYSYRRIVGAIILRGALLGSALGAVVGTIVIPIAGTVIGAGVGAIIGFLSGTIDGLFLACTTWLCRPFYMPRKFTRFTTIGGAFVAFIGVHICLGIFSSFQVMNPTVMILASIAALASSWATYRVAKNIAAADLPNMTTGKA
ncbi:MAG: glycine zipper domain-containing protein [Anaerolineae bacterium]|jgi:hypothetical protein|nr:glycine zipper domain-containing protein [Anaerolineae bacterium]